MSHFAQRPLLVLALGGNALSPPESDEDGYQAERDIIHTTGRMLSTLADNNIRLLIVHGNGPQVGRLMRHDPAQENLDIHVAQTQGELGYLLAAATRQPMVALLTTVEVQGDVGPAVKPVGPILRSRPDNTTPAVQVDAGWRVTVPSPRPARIVEFEAIETLLSKQHVIAGGGGGIPLTATGAPVQGVVDKDWVASWLAIKLRADRLIFATNVPHVYTDFDTPDASPLTDLNTNEASQMITNGSVGVGSMSPKLESAVDYVNSTGREARICHIDDIAQAWAGAAGTSISQP